jgi:hypothetical protein
MILDGNWAGTVSQLDKVAKYLGRARAELNRGAKASSRLPDGGFQNTQAELLEDALAKRGVTLDESVERLLWNLESAASDKHKELTNTPKRGQKGFPHVNGAVMTLANWWEEELGRPAMGNRLNNRVAFTAKRDESVDAAIYQGSNSECRVVDFISDVLEMYLPVKNVTHKDDDGTFERLSIPGVEAALDALPKR